jgi:hypothetical protein
LALKAILDGTVQKGDEIVVRYESSEGTSRGRDSFATFSLAPTQGVLYKGVLAEYAKLPLSASLGAVTDMNLENI